MAIKYLADEKIYIGLSTDDRTGFTYEGMKIYLTDLEKTIICHEDTWSDYIVNTSANINVGDIEIGAVEIKNSTDDTRATVGANGLYVDIQNIKAGSSIIGKFGIDQTTNGTTNGVSGTRKNDGTDTSSGKFHLTTGGTDGSNLRPLLVDNTGKIILGVSANIIGKVTTDQTTHGTTDKVAADLYFGGNAVTSTNAIPDYVPAYYATATITRSSTTTAYTSGQIILNSGATVLPEIDLTTLLGFSMANRKIAITTVLVISDNGANTAWNGFIDIFGVNNPATTTSLADYATFNPTAAALVSNFRNTIDSITNTRKYGTTSNLSWQTDMIRKCLCDANGKLYLAPVCTSGYTPKNGEVFSIMLKFYLLN